MSESPAGVIRVPSMRRRFAAFMFDGLILAFCASVVLGAYASVFGPEASEGGAIALVVVVGIAASVLPLVHEGGSFGQVAFGLQVVDLDGRRLSWPHALGRVAAFMVFAPLGALSGGAAGLLVGALVGVGDDWAGIATAAVFGLFAWTPATILDSALGLATHDRASRSIVILRGDGKPFASRLVPAESTRTQRGLAGMATFMLVASLLAYLALPSGPSTGVARPDRTAGPLGVSDVVVSGTIYVPKGQQFSVTPTQLTTSAVSGRPRGLASLGAGWCSGKSCDVLANARVRFVAPSRYGWQPLADTGNAATTDAQGSYRMILPQRYAVASTPTYVMATDPGEHLAVIAEVAANQQRPGVGITLDVDHSTTYLVLLRCPGGGTLGTCVSSAGDPSAEQLEKALAARFKEMGNAGDLRTPERTIGALVASPAVVAALEAAVAAGHAPTAATAALVAATRASPPLVAVTGPASPQPTAAPPRSAPAAVRSPPRTTAPTAAAVRSLPPATVPATPLAVRPPTIPTTLGTATPRTTLPTPIPTPPIQFLLLDPPPNATAGVSYPTYSFCRPAPAGLTDVCGGPFLPTSDPAGGTSPYRFELRNGFPPAGLRLSMGGLLQGTPLRESAGAYTFTVCAIDFAGAVSCRSVTMTVRPAPTPTPAPAQATPCVPRSIGGFTIPCGRAVP